MTLTVTNDHGQSGTATTVITAYVNEVLPGPGPTASFVASTPVKTYFPTTPTPTNPALYVVTFSPADSHAASGHEVKYYLWSFGDGFSETLTTSSSVQHVYSLGSPSHTFVVTLTVIDEQGDAGHGRAQRDPHVLREGIARVCLSPRSCSRRR